jgi:hypothetical protein
VSSSGSAGVAGIRYCSVSHRPRSTSAQRRLQNGRALSDAGLPQIGQAAADCRVSAIVSLDDPPRRIQAWVRP